MHVHWLSTIMARHLDAGLVLYYRGVGGGEGGRGAERGQSVDKA